ncbi:hypothetical protein P3X46_002510 [Hevea brasiliensis]|uniref:Uncharacterized protein n=1 Tax=Hevea brasiliensis TaxID=3981 RepID=A0ABQ9N5W5_HEVBR|nr:hypothetical protein P3X46_002510 [Hevea brasiliensis]
MDFEMSDPIASNIDKNSASNIDFNPRSCSFKSHCHMRFQAHRLSIPCFCSLLNKKANAFALLNGFLSQSVSFYASLILQFATLLDLTTCYCLFKVNVSFINYVFM